jgi:hypothetical protein
MKPPQKPQIRRRKNGTFPKGVSGNPGGRPKEEREIVEAIRRRADEIVAGLLRAALAKKPNVKASSELLNRAYGKAKQVVELTGADGGPLQVDLSKLSTEQVRQLRELVAVASTGAKT